MGTEGFKSQHPGSTQEEIDNEPEWNSSHSHKVGFLNGDYRRPGFTHDGEQEDPEREQRVEEQLQQFKKLQDQEKAGKLENFQDVMQGQLRLQQSDPTHYPPTWRFVVDSSEDWIKKEQPWPANLEAERKQEEAEKKAQAKKDNEQGDDENKWRRENGSSGPKHHDAYAVSGNQDAKNGQDSDSEKSQVSDRSGEESDSATSQSSDDEQNQMKKKKSEYQKLREKYSPQEIALLRSVEGEKRMRESLRPNDGKRKSPAYEASLNRPNTIDVADQGTPDNWIPRSDQLVRLTGQHPLNAEPKLSTLYDASSSSGLITPNQLHYNRNHGAVPRLYWETHTLDIENGKLLLSMKSLTEDFESVNIPVALACDGNRRGELNLRKKSKGFSWGSSAISCAYWKGPHLRDVLAAAGVPDKPPPGESRWVNFEGADELSEGRYATCIPLEYAMDRNNDVLLAYQMNDLPLPGDHGYPVRVIIPGYVGGRNVKWLSRVWITSSENNSYYHIWDNRVLPPFVTEKDGNFAEALFSHPSTACNEQNLNSIIAYPAQGETLTWEAGDGDGTYRIKGLAYDGAGCEVQRVEVSLDDGETWLWCVRTFPDYPLRHGSKFWAWIFWHVDVEKSVLFRSRSITVRCHNVFKNTQPREAEWNIMGMMNNGWYVVKSTLQPDHKTLLWQHPVDMEDKSGGWMIPSVENQLAAANQNSGIPDKQFTREEVEKHSTQEDCWLVVNNNVYDCTAVLKWHPGGASSILAYAGRLTGDTTTNFESIHDDYAHKKLAECAIGRLTEKAANFIKASAEAEAKKAASGGNKDVLLQKTRWTTVTLSNKKQLSEDTYAYTFQLRKGFKSLGLNTCQHIQVGIHMRDKLLIRSYTPTNPIRSCEEDGTFELTVKTYLADEKQPGGAMSNFLHTMPLGSQIEVRGPTGEIEYKGNGLFLIEGAEKTFTKVNLILGGSGVTPGYQLIARILRDTDDKTALRVVDANKSESDILLHQQLDDFAEKHAGQFRIEHVLSHASSEWKGTKGHVNAEIIRDVCFAPAEDTATFLCGPPAMITKAAMPALTEWGFVEEKNMYGF